MENLVHKLRKHGSEKAHHDVVVMGRDVCTKFSIQRGWKYSFVTGRCTFMFRRPLTREVRDFFADCEFAKKSEPV